MSEALMDVVKEKGTSAVTGTKPLGGNVRRSVMQNIAKYFLSGHQEVVIKDLIEDGAKIETNGTDAGELVLVLLDLVDVEGIIRRVIAERPDAGERIIEALASLDPDLIEKFAGREVLDTILGTDSPSGPPPDDGSVPDMSDPKPIERKPKKKSTTSKEK